MTITYIYIYIFATTTTNLHSNRTHVEMLHREGNSNKSSSNGNDNGNNALYYKRNSHQAFGCLKAIAFLICMKLVNEFEEAPVEFQSITNS